ncbi:MAG: histidine--tRNA ligase [Chitinivibrionales bacterium]|nr:histidine--tRNA ligase [Chitinivibrionales bacterium]
MQVPSAPKGTRDFYPEEMAFRERIFNSWKNTCERYGFECFDAPLFEQLSLYTQKSGDEIEKQLYTFEDKGGRLMALRPEMTPSLARMVASKGTELKRPVRWYSIPRLFRYEKMQKGRLREFFQLNMDILGIKECTADAELIAASADIMRDLGFAADDFSIMISSRDLLEELFLSYGLEQKTLPALYAILDKRHKVAPDEFEAGIADIIPNQSLREKVITTFNVKSLDDLRGINPDLPSLQELARLFEYLDNYGMNDYVQFDIGIVRGLAYYTGIVFELFDRKRSLRAIAGGGRYDNLVKNYGGPDTPAVGFAAGDVVLGELLKLKENTSVALQRSRVFIVYAGNEYPGKPIRIAQQIRRNNVSCEYALRKVNIGKQMKRANSCGAEFAVIIGEEEETTGKVKLKNMRSGSETVINENQLIDELHMKLKN